MAGGSDDGTTYNLPVGWIYIFNLIVGVGALGLPSGFGQGGLILGTIFLGIIGFLAFVTVTWIIEVQAAGNALLLLRKENDQGSFYGDPFESERGGEYQTSNRVINNIQREEEEKEKEQNESKPLLTNYSQMEYNKETNSRIFQIKERIELGRLAALFLGKKGQNLFYAILIIYLFGDLAIYSVIVTNSLVTFISQQLGVGTSPDLLYYLCLTCFALVIIPTTFLNFQKTKYLQYATLATRNFALFLMIGLSMAYWLKGMNNNPDEVPKFDYKNLPAMFGVGIYAFMCHHSLPSIVTPIRNKSRLNALFIAVFFTIFVVYTLLCSTAVLAFGRRNELSQYNLVFADLEKWNLLPISLSKLISGFLDLFPVFTLTSNFPLIAITLRNNMMSLIPWQPLGSERAKRYIFALIGVLPSFLIAFLVNVFGARTIAAKWLVLVTGSYPGIGIMFLIPAALVTQARRKIRNVDNRLENPHSSPFSHPFFVVSILFACAVALGFIIWNTIHNPPTSSSSGGH